MINLFLLLFASSYTVIDPNLDSLEQGAIVMLHQRSKDSTILSSIKITSISDNEIHYVDIEENASDYKISMLIKNVRPWAPEARNSNNPKLENTTYKLYDTAKKYNKSIALDTIKKKIKDGQILSIKRRKLKWWEAMSDAENRMTASEILQGSTLEIKENSIISKWKVVFISDYGPIAIACDSNLRKVADDTITKDEDIDLLKKKIANGIRLFDFHEIKSLKEKLQIREKRPVFGWEILTLKMWESNNAVNFTKYSNRFILTSIGYNPIAPIFSTFGQ